MHPSTCTLARPRSQVAQSGGALFGMRVCERWCPHTWCKLLSSHSHAGPGFAKRLVGTLPILTATRPAGQTGNGSAPAQQPSAAQAIAGGQNGAGGLGGVSGPSRLAPQTARRDLNSALLQVCTPRLAVAKSCAVLAPQTSLMPQGSPAGCSNTRCSAAYKILLADVSMYRSALRPLSITMLSALLRHMSGQEKLRA